MHFKYIFPSKKVFKRGGLKGVQGGANIWIGGRSPNIFNCALTRAKLWAPPLRNWSYPRLILLIKRARPEQKMKVFSS